MRRHDPAIPWFKGRTVASRKALKRGFGSAQEEITHSAWILEAIMDKGKLTQRQRRAYSYAAIATAIYVSKMITIGPIDLDDYDYRSAKLIEFRAVLELDQDRRVAGAAAIALNWSTLAQSKIGAPESDFANESLIRLHGVDDEIGLHAMNKNWSVIEALAQALLQKGRLTEAEALAIIGSIHGATDLNS